MKVAITRELMVNISSTYVFKVVLNSIFIFENTVLNILPFCFAKKLEKEVFFVFVYEIKE